MLRVSLLLILRTGYGIWLDFDKRNERFVGMRVFFDHFSIKRGHTLLFKHYGGFQFKVCIIDLYGSEIQYPNILPASEDYEPSHGMYFFKICLQLQNNL